MILIVQSEHVHKYKLNYYYWYITLLKTAAHTTMVAIDEINTGVKFM